MANIKCKACGKRYDYYEHGCCPDCGAYNRPPRRNRVDVDGTVHHLNDSEFFDDSAARRRQSGKVCFEREECHEDKVRRSASPFDSVPMQKKKKDGSSAGGVRKLVKTVGIAVILANLLPLLLTMCSFSDVIDGVEDFFTNVSVEPVRPEPLPDGETEHTTQMGNTFLWWDHNAIVMDAALAELGDGAYQLNMTMIREEAYDEPVVFYTTMDGYQEKSGCDGVTQLDDVTYIYHYTLENYARGDECYAFFDSYNGNVYCEVKVPLEHMAWGDEMLPETPPDDSSVQVATHVGQGEPFLWWAAETTVTGIDVVEDGSDTEVWLSVTGDVGEWEVPTVWYLNEYRDETQAYCEQSGPGEGDEWMYIFRMDDRLPGSECWAVFADDVGEVRVLLTNGDTPVTTMPQKVIVNDVVLNTSGKTTIVEAMVQTDPDQFLPMPTLRYTDKNGEQQEAECRNYIRKDSGDVTYDFRVKNMAEGSSLALRFVDPLGWEPTMNVPLN